MHGRLMLAGLALLGVAACSDGGAQEEWVQKCVLSGKTRATCACLEKDLKPEWRDFGLMDEVNQMDALSQAGMDAFIGVSNAMSKCMTAS